ncbi:MAG: Nif11-like leader peptide family natural product precursor [Oscillospiraceae bacterium]|nr:Nif11-like leader peptide family natural product precursor [Oscillospiraceae bacterium]MCL2279647.1 Nif11-like leader peptide family natural product precursor [Oscillospiraceae bacterium]
MTNVQKFYEALIRDEALRNRVQKLNEKYGDKKPSEKEMLAESVRFAESEGYSFTVAELEEYTKAKKAELGGKLDESELEAVAGGSLQSWPTPISGGCVCVFGGGGGGRHSAAEIAWGCGCPGYGQGGDARDWHAICLCLVAGSGARK